jgi:glycosyltransferase involved in cell wall biosynthesis
MKVLLDDVFFNMARSGVARYWESIVREWSRSGILSSHGIELTILNRSGALEDYGFPTIGFSRRNGEFDYRALERNLLESICRSENIDVFTSTYFTWVPGPRNLCVIYDLIPEVFNFELAARDWVERRLAPVVADSYVAISESSRQDLVAHYNFVNASDVSIARPGIDHATFTRASDDDIAAFRRKSGLSRPYLLVPGQRHTRPSEYKNVRTVLDAIARHGSADLDVVFTGGEDVEDWEIEAVNMAGAQLHAFRLDDTQLALAYSGATVVVYPSLYEGFGMPPLEALAVGTPVITTLTSSLPEAVGTLSLDFDGISADAFMTQLRASQSPDHVRHIREAGPRWAAGFSWTQTADDMARALVACGQSSGIRSRDSFVAALREYNNHSIELQR